MTGTNAMRRAAMLVFAGVQIAALQAAAPPASAQPAGAAPAAATPDKPPVTMEAPTPGDHWVFESRDEILGTVTATRQSTITDVTAKDITVRLTNNGQPEGNNFIYDRSWNLIDRGDVRFSPNDGEGFRAPLTVGKTWTFKSNYVTTKTGDSWTRSGTSKVVAQESVTTKAGTFDTFKIETSATQFNVANPSRVTKFVLTVWHAPSINHWVKRTYVARLDGHLTQNLTGTLLSYGRRQGDPAAAAATP